MAKTASVTVKIGKERIAEWVRELLAEAWDEGWRAGNPLAASYADQMLGGDLTSLADNPYRK